MKFVVFKSGFRDKGPVGISLDKIESFVPAQGEVMNEKGVGFHDGVKVYTSSYKADEETVHLLDISFNDFCSIVGAFRYEEILKEISNRGNRE